MGYYTSDILTLYISLIILHMAFVLVMPCIIALHSLTIYLFSVVRFQGFNVLLIYVVITQRSGALILDLPRVNVCVLDPSPTVS